MTPKRRVAVEIAVQTQVLNACPVHHLLYVSEDDKLDRAFALAGELFRLRKPYVREFQGREELAELLVQIIGDAPGVCPQCAAPLGGGRSARHRGSFAQHLLQGR